MVAMAVPYQLPSYQSSVGVDTPSEGDPGQAHKQIDEKRSAAINDEMPKAIANASALTERTAIELADLERRITEFKERIGQNSC
jgi:hypothetical protein